MKETMNILRTYNLVNSNGNKLRLYLGRIEGSDDYFGDKGFRWCFVGNRIPMPVRSDTWFNGFPENIMLDWLKGNGWALRSRVEMGTGKAIVYELPFVDKTPSKGNEKPSVADLYGTSQYPALGSIDRPAFERVVRDLVGQGNRATAARLYRYAHGGTLHNASEAVNVIITE